MSDNHIPIGNIINWIAAVVGGVLFALICVAVMPCDQRPALFHCPSEERSNG